MPQTNVTVLGTRLDTILIDLENKNLIQPKQPANKLHMVFEQKAQNVMLDREGKYESTVADGYNISSVPGGRNINIPNGKNQIIPSVFALGITEHYANTELTGSDLDFEGSTDTSLINTVDMSINNMFDGIAYYKSALMFGNGTGQVATVGTTGSSIAAGGTADISCDNTYLDLGFDNTMGLIPGAWIDIYRSTTLVATGMVKYNKPTYVRNSTNTQTGSFTFVNYHTAAYTPTADDKIYLASTYGSTAIPQGLRTLVNPALSGGNDVWGIDGSNPFQNHRYGSKWSGTTAIARDSAEAYMMRSSLFRANAAGTDIVEITASNFATDTGVKLSDWDLSTLSNCMSKVNYSSTNRSRVDFIICNQFMAEKIYSLAKANIEISQTRAQTMTDARQAMDIFDAQTFTNSNGESIPIIVDRWMPSNEIIGMSSNDMFMLNANKTGYLRRNAGGGIWEPTWDKNNYQAPYRYFMNFGAYRCDKFFSIQGLKDINN